MIGRLMDAISLSGILLPSLLTLGASAAEKTPVDWIKPQIDTKKPRFFYFSSACQPFGLVSLSPDTKPEDTWDSGYRYYDDKIQCFSHIHGWQIAGIPVMPLAASSDHKDYASKFSHDGEIVKAGYHKVHLDDHGVTAELTSTPRVGFHRYTFHKDEDAQKTKFYTDLWHAHLGRRLISDVDHSYPDNTGPQTVVRKGKRHHYNFDALWGAQWSLNVLWPMAWPELMDDFADTMINMYQNGGMIPRSPSGGNDTFYIPHDEFVMGGTLELTLGPEPNKDWGLKE